MTVFRVFLSVLFEKCPASQLYDNLDARLLRVEAELWAKVGLGWVGLSWLVSPLADSECEVSCSGQVDGSGGAGAD